MKSSILYAAGIAVLAFSASAHAAQSDYFLKIEGVDGEAQVAEWSFGACNSGQCATVRSPRDVATGQSTGKRQHEPRVTASQNTQSLRESPTSEHSHHSSDVTASESRKTTPPRATYDVKKVEGARLQVAAGDLDGDGAPDLAFATKQVEVSSFTLHFDKIEATWREVCKGKHFDKATLRSGVDSFELTGVSVACTTASAIQSGPRQTMDVSTSVAAGDAVSMVLTGGKIKDNKTGLIANLK